MATADTKRSPVTPRALLLGLLLVAGLAWLTPYNDYYIGATLVAGNYLPIGGFFVLALLCVVVNGLLRFLRPGAALRPAELLVIWGMIATASSIPASGLMRFVIPHPVAPLYYATPENKWEKDLLIHLPRALYIQDERAVKDFFERSPDGSVPWAVWRQPLVAYGAFVLPLYISFFCLSTLLRRLWVDHERFTFPLVQLPVAMTEAPEPGRKLAPLWYSGALWVPVLLLTGVHTMNGLHLFYPEVPRIGLYDIVLRGLKDRPWNVLNGTGCRIYPLVIGFGYLLKSEVLLSLWFFYVFYRLEGVVAAALGINPAQSFIGYGWPAFGTMQAAGMAVGLVGWILYKSRAYFAGLWHTRPGEDREEAMPLRWATGGWLAATAAMFGWLWGFGQNPATAFFTVFFGTVAYVVLSWMVAQGGVLFLQSPWSGAETAARLFGFDAFTPRGMLVSTQIESITMLDLREFMLPHLFNAQKSADAVHVSRRGLLLALAAAVVVTLILSGEESIRLPYQYGAAMMYDKWAYFHSPQRPLKFVASQMAAPLAPSPWAWINLVAGAAGCWVLMLLQSYVIGFPLHPAGFIFAPGYPLGCFWFSFLLAWILKGVLLRYGGLKVYHRCRPFFFGLILGDTINGAVWIIIGLLTRRAYAVLPG